ncbi:MAG: oligopeptide transporter, OPT family [Candidatus Krumholzibacteriota bacterium]|nr:oligopeptide transporter, OPT family [Candidatus Krumholzibacteriota bacterium]
MADIPTKLPQEAYRELKEGEVYHPIVPASSTSFEVTLRAILTGIIMAVIFSVASAYLALKTGQGMEAAIPIAILAIGLANIFARKSTILENVIIQSVGAASSAVVAGAVFTIPALYMLDIEVSFWHIFLTAFLGGSLGVLFLIPLRDYLMVREHGRLPFPEAMATTEILVAGESAGHQAKTLIWSAVVAFIFDLSILTFGLWKEIITFHAVWVGRWLEERFSMAVRIDSLSAIVGLGYIVGIKYASIIAAGSFLSFLVLIPLVHYIGAHLTGIIPPGTIPISEMSVDDIFGNYVRLIGIGGIAGAGIMGIVKSVPSIGKSFMLGIKGIADAKHAEADDLRTERNLKLRDVFIGIAAIGLCLWLFFRGGFAGSMVSTVGVLLALGISFLFTMVSARAIGLIGTNPVSGMTLATLIITSVILTKVGLSGKPGMFVALIVGGVVCTSLAVAGAFATDLKIGYWIGATPRNQQLYKFTGILVSAVFCALAMMLFNRIYVLGSPNMPAPQATAMKEIIFGLMGPEAGVQWILFSFGMIISVILAMAGVPALAFALGMYLPIELNTAVLLGGFIAWLVGRGGSDVKVVKMRKEKGILVASGLIAGGSIAGVISAVIAGLSWDSFLLLEYSDTLSELAGIVMLVLLSVFIFNYSRRVED